MCRSVTCHKMNTPVWRPVSNTREAPSYSILQSLQRWVVPLWNLAFWTWHKWNLALDAARPGFFPPNTVMVRYSISLCMVVVPSSLSLRSVPIREQTSLLIHSTAGGCLARFFFGLRLLQIELLWTSWVMYFGEHTNKFSAYFWGFFPPVLLRYSWQIKL